VPRASDEHALEIACHALAQREIDERQSCHDAARKTISTYFATLEQQERRGSKRKVLPEA
jgi:hypothetical protein